MPGAFASGPRCSVDVTFAYAQAGVIAALRGASKRHAAPMVRILNLLVGARGPARRHKIFRPRTCYSVTVTGQLATTG